MSQILRMKVLTSAFKEPQLLEKTKTETVSNARIKVSIDFCGMRRGIKANAGEKGGFSEEMT